MITTKELKTLADFEAVKRGDFLAVEWHRDSYIGNKRTRFAVYEVFDAPNNGHHEIILQKKNNVYFNYQLFLGMLEGASNAKSVTLVKSDSDVNDSVTRTAEMVVRNWKTVPLSDLVDACKHIYGAKYLLLQRREVVEQAAAKGVRAGDLADQMIANKEVTP